MICWVCDKGPIAGEKHNRELCYKHFDLAQICEVCGGFFVMKSEKSRTCKNCNKNGNYLPPSDPNASYTPATKDYGVKNCKNCDQEFVLSQSGQKCCSRDCSKNYNRIIHNRGRIIIFDRDEFQCIYCGKTSHGDYEELHIDHVIPKSKGGSDRAENLVTSCISCNLGKNNNILHSLSLIRAEIQQRNEKADIDPRQIINLSAQHLVAPTNSPLGQ